MYLHKLFYMSLNIACTLVFLCNKCILCCVLYSLLMSIYAISKNFLTNNNVIFVCRNVGICADIFLID